jgi:hypothetical protein
MTSYFKYINGLNFEFVYFDSLSDDNFISSNYYIPISVKYEPPTGTVLLTTAQQHVSLCMPDILNEIQSIIQTNIGFYNHFDCPNRIVYQPIEVAYIPPNSNTKFCLRSNIIVGIKFL